MYVTAELRAKAIRDSRRGVVAGIPPFDRYEFAEVLITNPYGPGTGSEWRARAFRLKTGKMVAAVPYNLRTLNKQAVGYHKDYSKLYTCDDGRRWVDLEEVYAQLKVISGAE